MREVRAEGKCKLGHEFVEGDAICRWIRLEDSFGFEGRVLWWTYIRWYLVSNGMESNSCWIDSKEARRYTYNGRPS